MTFGEIAIGEQFVFHDETLKKTDKSIAEDYDGYGFIFKPETPVERIVVAANPAH